MQNAGLCDALHITAVLSRVIHGHGNIVGAAETTSLLVAYVPVDSCGVTGCLGCDMMLGV